MDVGRLRGEQARPYLVKRQEVETRELGSSLIQQVLPSQEIILRSYTGADPGTGIIVLGLSETGVAPGQANTFIVDKYGRITHAWTEQYSSGGGGGNANSIANQSTYEQNASFWIGGTGRISGSLTVGSISSGPIAASAVTLSTPLSTASGGTGAATVPASYVLVGPSAGAAAAPAFRLLSASDLPDYPWPRIQATPTTVAGYGIVDVYTRSQADAKFLSLPNGANTQYLRGDKAWADLTTAAVQEATSLYYTDARARAAISAAGNLSYTQATGILEITPTPVFDSVTLSNTPTQANQAATKAYVDTAIGGSAAVDAVDRFVVSNIGNRDYALAATPTTGSTQVYLNGIALFEGVVDDYTLSSNTVTLNAAVILTAGDVMHVRYRHH